MFKYLKAATKATNDKYARIDRAEVVADLIRSTVSGQGKSAEQSISKTAAATAKPAARPPKSPKKEGGQAE